jgi:hypothetical protein
MHNIGAKTMKNFLIILTAAIIFKPVNLTAEPLVKSYISNDANWIVHIDYDMLRKSQLGHIFMSEMVNSRMEEEFKKFKDTYSFHPINDVNSITIYGQGKNRENAVTLIKGRFDKGKLLGFVKMNSGYRQIEYNGMIIQQWKQPEKNFPQSTAAEEMYGGFYDKNIIILNRELTEIEKAMDVLHGLRPGAGDDFWGNNIISNNNYFEAFVKNVSEFVDSNSCAFVKKNTKRLVLEMGENDKNVFIKTTLYADSKETIEGIKKLLDGMIAYLTLEESKTPELVQLAKKIQLTVDDNKVQISLEMEPDTMKLLTKQFFPR